MITLKLKTKKFNENVDLPYEAVRQTAKKVQSCLAFMVDVVRLDAGIEVNIDVVFFTTWLQPS